MYSFQLCADTMKYVHKTLQLHMQSIHLQIDLYTMLTHSVTYFTLCGFNKIAPLPCCQILQDRLSQAVHMQSRDT